MIQFQELYGPEEGHVVNEWRLQMLTTKEQKIHSVKCKG